MQKFIKMIPPTALALLVLNQIYFKKWGFNLEILFAAIFGVSVIYIAKQKPFTLSRRGAFVLAIALFATVLICILQIKRVI